MLNGPAALRSGSGKRPAGVTAMTDHDTRQIIIALTAIVLAWSIVGLLTIAFGQLFPTQWVALTDRPPEWLGNRLPCQCAGQ
jgi:hypothetical protein